MLSFNTGIISLKPLHFNLVLFSIIILSQFTPFLWWGGYPSSLPASQLPLFCHIFTYKEALETRPAVSASLGVSHWPPYPASVSASGVIIAIPGLGLTQSPAKAPRYA